ncbi:hypothetical protein BGZ97_011651 [Linnemannia gamsii]|uniref:Uncharacterized protein n=1 Tax=Linnemannia gamsii TaxID=64522 RepID=A0A9P6UVD9_9FUNG|nr:hypothetical protein BGZ97_011651 [Linnemannia gamsii]
MAKKMERLEASTEFRPFKFRIQAFTNAFHDSLIQHGLTEDVLPLRKVKLYLWKHRYISRFNEDGKKQKSKGNHVWNIEARKISNVVTVPTSALASGSGLGDAPLSASTTPSVATPSTSSAASTPSIKASSTATTTTTGFYDLLPPDMDPKQIGPEAISAAGGGLGIIRRPTSPVRWEFREYSSRIAGQVIKYARVGVPYVYSPRIWDAQMSCPAAKFSSPWLPSWLKWHRGELKGIPSAGDESCTILVVAEYVREGEECRLEMSFPLTVCDLSKEVEMIQQQHTPSGVSGEEDAGGYFERGNGDSAGAVGVSTSADQDGDSLMKIQLEGSSSFQQQQHGREKDGDEKMMIAMKEDEDMEEEKEEQHSVEHEHEQTSSYSQNSRSYYSHHSTHNQKLHECQATATSLSQDEHQREQRQAQQRLQRLQLQEHQHHQLQQELGEEQKPALFQSTTAPSSAGTTASFYMNPPSSRGSISSSNGSSAYVEEEEESESEQSEDEDESDGGEEGMESIADGVDDEAGKTRKMKTRTSTRTSTSSSASTARHHRRPSRARRSTILQETNKRRKHD